MSPASHDMAVAKISHLPHILSYNLCSTVSKKDIKIAGSGFKDTTMIAKSEPRMWAEIFLQNRKSLLRSIGDFEKSLSILKSFVIKNKKAHLIKRLNFAKAKRDSVG